MNINSLIKIEKILLKTPINHQKILITIEAGHYPNQYYDKISLSFLREILIIPRFCSLNAKIDHDLRQVKFCLNIGSFENLFDEFKADYPKLFWSGFYSEAYSLDDGENNLPKLNEWNLKTANWSLLIYHKFKSYSWEIPVKINWNTKQNLGTKLLQSIFHHKASTKLKSFKERMVHSSHRRKTVEDIAINSEQKS